MLLAIETSCDETAIAVLDPSRFSSGSLRDFLLADLVSSQIKLHEPYGGVVPELAAREHIRNLPVMVEKALTESGVGIEQLTAVAVTRGPGLKGCLLVGLCFAKTLAMARSIPLLALNHIEGHIFAAQLMDPAERPQYPMLALVVSGGHTMLVRVAGERCYQIVAKTRDDAAGEAFDKGAMLLGLPYPGGPSLSKAAAGGNAAAFRFPVGVSSDPASFSFSGLKTALQRTVSAMGESAAQATADLAASFQQAIVRALTEKSVACCRAYGIRSFLLTGGVAANACLRDTLKEELKKIGVQFAVPDRRWCTDNAAMVGALACSVLAGAADEYASWRQQPARGTLGPGVPQEIGALAKWPIDQL